jgi:hypothetical protein
MNDMNVSPSEVQKWGTEGFVRREDIISEHEIDRLFQVIWVHYLAVTGAPPSELIDRPGRDFSTFHDAMIELRKRSPKAFGQIYDRIQTNSVVYSIALKPEITQMAADLLSEDPMCLSASGILLRMDPPQDTRNVLSWHQDQSYMPVNGNGLNGLVVWIPLQDVSERNGTIRVRVGSHKTGHIKVSLVAPEAGRSEQYSIPEAAMENYIERAIDAKAGDAVVMPMNLVHASGQNTSDRIRFTLIVRFHRSLTPDFVPFRFDRVLVKNAEPLSIVR